MGKWLTECARLTDDELESRLKLLSARERQAAVCFVIHLMEADKRRLYAEAGYPSLFVYCVKELGLSEDAAYKRIRVARAAADYPALLDALAAGKMHLVSVTLLAPHLTAANWPALLQEAQGKTKREIEFMVAALHPDKEKRDCLREIVPVSGRRARVSFDADIALLDDIKRARQILKHKYPKGLLNDIFKEALEDFLSRKDWGRRPPVRKRSERPASPSSSPSAIPSRRIPLWVCQEVWRRDGGQCAFETREGQRCPERGGLEFDHVVPWALGGPSNRPDNIRLLCRTHNQSEARRIFGEPPGTARDMTAG